MTHDDSYRTKVVDNELSCLKTSISYAENCINPISEEWIDPSIFSETRKIKSMQDSAYKEFIRVAWGKAVVIESEMRGEVVYRLSQSSATFPRGDIATPLSPIGRLVSIAQPGLKNTSAVLGDYEVKDVRFFERYTGPDFKKHLYNFKYLSSEGLHVFSIENLTRWLSKHKTRDRSRRNSVEVEAEQKGETTPKNQAMKNSDRVLPQHGLMVEEEDLSKSFALYPESEIAEDEYGIEDYAEDESEGIYLSNRFYVNLTQEQYDLAHANPNGLVFVYGVAGSGKTSVALGRSKSLAQRGELSKSHELYNPDFPEETQLGVVRTGELISYLRETCNALSLHRMPIVEYKQVYEELKDHWDIVSKNSDRKTKYYFYEDELNAWSSRNWYDTISAEMLDAYKKTVIDSIKSPIPAISNLDGDIDHILTNALEEAFRNARSNTDPIGFLARLDSDIRKKIETLLSG